jgi:hypothetical protein
MARDWSEFEVEVAVDDYFAMLLKELRGEQYSKTTHRHRLMKLLDDRSDGSVEFKHQNISAVLLDMGIPPIVGYRPRSNYQQLLADAVKARIANNRAIEPTVAANVDAEAEPVDVGDILSRLAPPPVPSAAAGQRTARAPGVASVARANVNYLEREARNRSLGRLGEDFALAFEKARLESAGCHRLARQVEHVSVTQGDGLGFDILSFEPGGEDRLIEVKTTRFGKETPFFVSRNELGVSEVMHATYHLYRIFTYRTNPRLYTLDGNLNHSCSLSPIQYLARVG